MEKKYNVIGVIPARYRSTRLPLKLLKNLCGKPLLQWTWENASSSRILDKLIIACDDPKVREVAEEFGAEVMMTSVQHTSGTDRIAEAARDIDVNIIINIQADEPLIHPSIVNTLAQEMINDSSLVMATVKKRIDDSAEIDDPSIVKVISDKDNFAIYFSRYPLPYFRDQDIPKAYYKHLGIYAYTKDFLYTYKNLPPSYLEKAEKLEQLRVVEAGFKIKVVETQFDSWGVDTEHDLQKLEKILQEKGYA
ncbi:MAG: 3-deoxy-manno-octulosonate cytidylyltransferase [Candidatus Omnitrophota bacterium]|nr:MAG: 3-deoxy-manno-octulosonate cytidylyltransferase [Candidatus Omnitrophota bacterium]